MNMNYHAQRQSKTIIVTVKEKDIQNEDLNKNLEISNNTAK